MLHYADQSNLKIVYFTYFEEGLKAGMVVNLLMTRSHALEE